MTRAIRFDSFGGPEVLQYREVELAAPGQGEARVAHRAIGVNFIDVYHRTGLYPLTLPSGLGGEGAGVVTAVGPGVTHVRPGDRVAYTAPAPLGSYADERVVDARWLVSLARRDRRPRRRGDDAEGPHGLVSAEAQLPRRSGDWILLYAAAGGVGLITAQWARELGARVIGIVEHGRRSASSRSAHGCEHVLLDGDDDSAPRPRALGGGVPVVYDSVGRTTFFQSLDCLRPHGVLVSFGNSSGKVEPFGLHELTKRGSLYVTRPTLYDFIRERGALEAGARRVLRARRARTRRDRGQPDLSRCATPRKRIAISRRARRRAPRS